VVLALVALLVGFIVQPDSGPDEDILSNNPTSATFSEPDEETLDREAADEGSSSVDPAPYAFAAHEFQQVSRPRAVGRVEIEPASPEATGAALAAAARELLLIYPDARVVAVFGYSPGEYVEGPYTRGKSEASRDGRGWTGDGQFSFDMNGDDDEGQIRVYVGSVIGETTAMDFPH